MSIPYSVQMLQDFMINVQTLYFEISNLILIDFQ